MAQRTKYKGIRRHGAGWQAYVRVNGKLYTSDTFPIDTPIPVMQKWIEDTKATYATCKLKGGGFAADVEAYLARRSSITSIRKIGTRLRYFVEKLGGDRHRHSIKREDVDAVLNELNKTVEPGTVLTYRGSLRAFFYDLDPDGANPVANAFHPGTPKPEPRGRDMALMVQAIDAMATGCNKTGNLSLSKVRARVIAFTGFPPATLTKITPADLRPHPMAATEVRVPRRKKGAGVESRVVPLTAQGSEAFALFHQANAYGYFNGRSLNACFKKGCKRVDIDPASIRLYDLRHSFLTHIYRTTRDQATVGRFALHSEGSPLTARYTSVAHEAVDRDAADAVSASLSTAPIVARSIQKLPTKVAKRQKLRLVS